VRITDGTRTEIQHVQVVSASIPPHRQEGEIDGDQDLLSPRHRGWHIASLCSWVLMRDMGNWGEGGLKKRRKGPTIVERWAGCNPRKEAQGWIYRRKRVGESKAERMDIGPVQEELGRWSTHRLQLDDRRRILRQRYPHTRWRTVV